jgi:chromosome segregation ATPase
LVEGEHLVLKAIDLVGNSKGKDQQVEEIRRALQALKLKDLEVDVTSTKLSLQQELTTLRSAIENGGTATTAVSAAPPPPALPTPPATSEKDLEKLRSLETENTTLRSHIKDFEIKLAAANDAIAKANGNAAESAKLEIQSLKTQLEQVKRESTAKDNQIQEKDAAIAAHLKKIDSLSKEVQSSAASAGSQEQALKTDIEKAKATAAQLEARLAATTREWEAKYGAKSQELTKLGEDKARELKELEARLEAEKEEMMEAMAQEIEVSRCVWVGAFVSLIASNSVAPTADTPVALILICNSEQEVETTKASEFEGLNKELEASKQRCAALQSSNKGVVAQLARLQTAVRALARDYKAHRTTSRTQLAELGQSIVAQYKPMFVGKLKVGCIYQSVCSSNVGTHLPERTTLMPTCLLYYRLWATSWR